MKTNTHPGRKKKATTVEKPAEPEVKCQLSVEAIVTVGAMYLRQGVASASVEDGSEVEVAVNLAGGAVLVTRYPKKKGEANWTTWVLTPEALVRAVLALETSEKKAAADAPKDEGP